jgi:UDP-N-acetylmuramoylalanine--D-glutamate ligase
MQKNFKGKRVTIMGLGLQGSGIAAVKFFHREGAKITVTDIKTKEKLSPSLEKLKDLKNIEYVLGQHRQEDFSRADLIIKGPGIPFDSKYLKIARKNKVPIETEAGVFFDLLSNPLIGITGTRGKSTTSQLIYEIIKLSGRKVSLGGNIKDKPLLALLENIKKDSWLVAELSSFQLESLGPKSQSPHIAVMTNLLEDHLNRYENLEAYHAAKEAIIRNQTEDDFAVLNYNDKRVRVLSAKTKAQICFFSQNRITGGRRVFVSDRKIFTAKGLEEELVLDLDRLSLIGGHRVESVLAAVAVAVIMKIDFSVIKKAVYGFKGLEHRLEAVKEVAGVLYINDTTATTPQAAAKAIASFGEPTILIAGGADKGLDFSPLVDSIIGSSNLKKIILLKGDGTIRLENMFKKMAPADFLLSLFLKRDCDSLEEALILAQKVAVAGDVVLLSPGCSSFGMFENEFARGDIFKELVNSF